MESFVKVVHRNQKSMTKSVLNNNLIIGNPRMKKEYSDVKLLKMFATTSVLYL